MDIYIHTYTSICPAFCCIYRNAGTTRKSDLKTYVNLSCKVDRLREELAVLPREARDGVEALATRKTALSAAVVELSGELDNSVGGGRRLLLHQAQHRTAALEKRMRATHQELCKLAGVEYDEVPDTPVFTAQGDMMATDAATECVGVQVDDDEIPSEYSDVGDSDIDEEYDDGAESDSVIQSSVGDEADMMGMEDFERI